MTGLLVASTEAADQLDVLCTCGTAPRTDRLSLSARSSGFAGRVLESGCAVGEPIDAKTNSYLATAASGARASYAAGAPIGSPGGPRGALCVGLPGRPPDPTTTLWVIESYARLASLCLHDRGALGGLLAAARLDGLTGCLNHAAIRTELEREIERCTRHQRTVSCCFVDLDRFKQINDRYGHVHGSRVLADIAAILRAGVRSGDTVGRYGGDEFILVLPDTDLDAAHALAARLRAQIRGSKWTEGYEPLDASIGVAQWQAGTTAAALLATADEALRRAKLEGGGAVVTAGGVAARTDRDIAEATA